MASNAERSDSDALAHDDTPRDTSHDASRGANSSVEQTASSSHVSHASNDSRSLSRSEVRSVRASSLFGSSMHGSLLHGSSRGSSVRGSSAFSALDIAARSVLESQLFMGTVASVVAERALDHHWDGLFQHAAMRVGHERAAHMLERLERVVEEKEEKEAGAALDPAPGPRAQLYRRAHLLLCEDESTRQARTQRMLESHEHLHHSIRLWKWLL